MLPIWAMIDRDLRKYFRSPVLMTVSLFLPLLQLVVIGNAFGGQIRGLSVALVNADRGGEAIRLREKFEAVEANARTFHVRPVGDLQDALTSTRNGSVAATIVIPENYSQRVGHGVRPALGLILDNTDPFVGSTLTAKLGGLLYIDDKARGFHEGYLATPISKAQLVSGMLAAGTTKAAFSGLVVTVLGSIVAGIGG